MNLNKNNLKDFLDKLDKKQNKKNAFYKKHYPHKIYQAGNDNITKLTQAFLEELIVLCKYTNKSLDELFDIYNNTPVFTGKNENQDFNDYYSSWDETTTIVNSINQFSLYYYLFSYLTDLTNGTNFTKVCDYGCGTASISISIFEKYPATKLYLYDLPNENEKYVNYKINLKKLKNISWQNALIKDSEKNFDLLICNDVLEHLPNSSEVFLEILNKIKPNGILILQAPWGNNHPEHISEAPINFYNGEAYTIFKNKLKPIVHFDNALHISGVYQVKK